MGIYNEYPLGVNGMSDWFASAGPNANIARAHSYPVHMGGLGATQEKWFIATPQPLPDAAHNLVQANPGGVFTDTHEIQIPHWVYYAGGGLALFILWKSLSKKK